MYLSSISGEIPKNLGQLSHLTVLDLSWNRLTGGTQTVHVYYPGISLQHLPPFILSFSLAFSGIL